MLLIGSLPGASGGRQRKNVQIKLTNEYVKTGGMTGQTSKLGV